MRHWRKVLVAGFLIFFWGFVWKFGEENFGSQIRFFVDIWDLRTYYNNGKWYPTGTQPYVDVPSEYPQVATYIFGWVHAFGSDEPRAGVAREIYFRAFRFVMLLTGYAAFLLLEFMKREKKWLALLLFLPGPLYYLFNRFDILPAFFCLLALYFVGRKKWSLSAFLLAVAAMTKWYAVLLMPSLIVYAWSVDGKIPWKPALVFALTMFFIALPTYLAGGMDALLLPYTFHLNRASETASLPNLILSAFNPSAEKPIAFIFLCLQLAASVLSFFFRIDTFDKLGRWWILIVGVFILFSKIYSPQWILWILPFLLLFVESTLDMILIILYGTLTYVGFPIVYDWMPLLLLPVHLVNLTILLVLVIRSTSNLTWKITNPFSHSLA